MVITLLRPAKDSEQPSSPPPAWQFGSHPFPANNILESQKGVEHQKIRILDRDVRITCNKLGWSFSESTNLSQRALLCIMAKPGLSPSVWMNLRLRVKEAGTLEKKSQRRSGACHCWGWVEPQNNSLLHLQWNGSCFSARKIPALALYCTYWAATRS